MPTEPQPATPPKTDKGKTTTKGTKRKAPKKSAAKEKKKYVLKKDGGFINELKETFAGAVIENADEKEMETLRRRFFVHDEGSANWATDKIVQAQAEVKRRQKTAAAYVKEAETNLVRLEYLFKWALQAWAKDNLAYGKKSVKLPAGTLAFRDTQEKVEVRDKEKTLKWSILNLPGAVKTTEGLLLEPLKNYYDENKKLPDGCDHVPAGENFSVK